MTPTRPYFLRALYEWIVVNDCTPYLAVNATITGVQVPRDYVEDGEITLNLSSSAIVDLKIDDDLVEFKAKFNGVTHSISIPMVAVLGVYAKENGQGMLFPEEPAYGDPKTASSDIEERVSAVGKNDKEDPPEPPKPSGKPQLKIVK